MKTALTRLCLCLVVLGAALSVSAPRTEAALSGQCNYQYVSPYYNSDGTGYVRAWVELYCSVSHTRESQVCAVANGNWYCAVSGQYYGTEFDATVAVATHSSSAWTWQTWWWAYDASTGEQWSGYGSCCHQLWRGPN